MIVLDTNVVSELCRPAPEPAVAAWASQHPRDDVFITATTVAELLFGIRCLPDGRRKEELTTRMASVVGQDFDGRVLPFDVVAAGNYALIASSRRHRGRPISVADAQIAAACRRVSATLATRNVKDFRDTGIDVVNPWEHDVAGP
ncbi:type II toxin-antitoxin system VapC family toxin [Phytoactinopolyspora halotolerans]|uniref:Ribonuclease VapC n=1 Tax=Phytoactinopolyspora halotolerans TaxID=1981512 RepID=A0A6L9SC38_9ACTN|nr:type II toxin-antitoxin system VapC family toxin [Phytoactinopolyspora halotolerans]NEE02108.1 type II toxin-antitoxin system VapC family toxin [Phytoactinopolyspora halotolerans]